VRRSTVPAQFLRARLLLSLNIAFRRFSGQHSAKKAFGDRQSAIGEGADNSGASWEPVMTAGPALCAILSLR
jgi:hypothetical protein